MQIELDAETSARIRKQAEEIALQKLVEQILSTFDRKQIAGEVKNLVTQALTKKLADQVVASGCLESAVQRAAESAEARVNKRLADLLAKGVTVRFTGET